MISPYDMISKSALPALRAMVSRRLRERYSLTQQEVADRLGVTQASVSNYSRKARGGMINLEKEPMVARAADKIAEMLSGEGADRRKALMIMTDVCDYIRFNHLMCGLHTNLEPEFPTQGCEACNGEFSGKSFDRLKLIVGQ